MIKLDIRRVVATNSKSAGVFIRFSSNGQIAISADAVRKLKIEDDDKAVFFQDNKTPKDWYFAFGKEGDYALKKTTKPNDDTKLFAGSGLRREVAASLELPKKTFRLWLSKEPFIVEGKELWKLNLRTS